MTVQNVAFVYGALRSGTTVFRLMLNAHPQIANPGEMDFLFDHLTLDATAPTGWRYARENLRNDRIFKSYDLALNGELDGLNLLHDMLDQLHQRDPQAVMSINLHRHVDRASAALPDARFIHLLRDPRDVARSAIGMGWAGTLYHGADIWTETELAWDRAQIDESRVLTLRYEDLITDPADHLTSACEFLGLPFDPTMLTYYENTTYSAPDPALVYQWKKRSTPTEIAQLESRAAELMQNRGYLPVSDAAPISRLTKTKLTAINKWYKWTFGIKRFGLSLYIGERITRWLRLKDQNLRLRTRMNTIKRNYQK